VDNWGCGWSNIHEGFDAIVTKHPLPDRAMIHTLRAPEVRGEGLPHGFMFLRLTDLRGYEERMIDFAEEPEELQMLIDIVLEYNMREIALMVKWDTDTLFFGDDLGMQTSLPTGPEKWRKYLKPCFMRMFEYVRQAGKYVYLHSDGHIHEIIPDLVACGVNVINPQIRANGLDNLARVSQGQVCLDLDLDRQLFPFCTPADVDAHVHEVVATLGSPQGGLWVKAEIGPDYPLENIEAIVVAMEQYRTYFAGSAAKEQQ
jgi:uroporphyrinogen-III decarboxylase